MLELCTPYLLINLLLFAVGLWVLIKGSDLFIDSAADIARSFHVSELAIGLTLVSIGTSLPELASSVYAAFCNQPEFIVGNIVGSCTTNITLILGAAALLGGPLFFPPKLLSRDTVIMCGVFALTAVLTAFTRLPGADGGIPGINRWSGALLLGLSVWYCFHLLRHSAAPVPEAAGGTSGTEAPAAAPAPLWRSLALLALGLVMVLAGSKLLLDNVVWGARRLHVSTLVISITVVAFGTSIPELAVTLAGVLKKRHELAIGNIVGSCTFNILLIFGLCAVIRPLEIAGRSGAINLVMLCVSGAALFGCMRLGRKLSRLHGALLLAIYFGFLVYNCRSLLGFGN